MKRFYYRFRIMTLTLALGMASVSFSKHLSNNFFTESNQIESNSVFYVYPFKASKIHYYRDHYPNKEEIIQNRDISLYDSAGRFSNCMVQTSEFNFCQQERVEARAFILNHLKEKKRGYIFYRWEGFDSYGDTHIFVEPDENGKWVVVSRNTGDLRFQHNISEKKAYIIRYKRAITDSYPFIKGERYLSLLDNEKNEIEKF